MNSYTINYGIQATAGLLTGIGLYKKFAIEDILYKRLKIEDEDEQAKVKAANRPLQIAVIIQSLVVPLIAEMASFGLKSSRPSYSFIRQNNVLFSYVTGLVIGQGLYYLLDKIGYPKIPKDTSAKPDPLFCIKIPIALTQAIINLRR